MTEGLKILKAEITNFKNLKHTEIDFGAGQSIMVVGPNESNKSSLIQALMSPLNAKYKPMEPINKDEDRASIELQLGGIVNGEEKSYTIEMYFSQDNKTGRLVLKDAEGSKISSPKTALESILGNISFDIDEFVRLSKTATGTRSEAGIKRQIEILKSLMPIEVRKELMTCDVKRKEAYDKRSEINGEIKRLEVQSSHNYTDDQLKLYSIKKDEGSVKKKLNDIGTEIENWQRINGGVEEKRKRLKDVPMYGNIDVCQNNLSVIGHCLESLKEIEHSQDEKVFRMAMGKYKIHLENDIAKFKAIPVLSEEIAKGEKWLESHPKPSTETIMKELEEIQIHNRKCDEISILNNMFDQICEKGEVSDKLSNEIKMWEEKKKEIFAQNPLPVKELTFDEENVLYKGTPFDETQHPSSTIIGVGVKIAMAMNPRLKVLVIKDGSLLDKNIANGILKMIEKNGFQLFIEMVSWDAKDMEIKFVEKEIA